MSETTEQKRLTGAAKFAVDMGPLAIFMIVYFFGQRLAPLFGASIAEGHEMFLAVAFFMPAYLIAFIYSVFKERRVAPMLLVTGVIIGVLGGLTLILQNKMFFYMKPTIAYTMFASVLAGGLIANRNFLKIIFDGALHLPDDAWRTLTKRYAIFFAVLAVANEIAWRYLMRDCDLTGEGSCPGEAHWVNLKIVGFTAATFIFTAFQAPIITKSMPHDEAGEN